MSAWRKGSDQWGAAFRRHNIDRRFAVAMAMLGVGLFAFFKLGEEVLEGETRSFDEMVMLAIRAPGDISQPIGPAWLSETVRDFTALGSTGVLAIVTVSAVMFLVFAGKRHAAVLLFVGVAGGVVVGHLLKLGFARPRPGLVPPGVPVFTDSFPSGHAMMSAVVYLTIGNLLARTQTSVAIKIYLLSLASFLTVLVGVSRVYLGVHWPSDVLAGWAIGACWALLWWLIMFRLQAAGAVEREEPPGP